jgi:hypothetical protein
MHSYMQTGLAFGSVGLVVMKFLAGVGYLVVGGCFILVGASLIIEAGRRYLRFRRAIAALREREARLGLGIGTVR